MRRYLMIAGLVLVAAPAAAEAPYYFHRAGVAKEAYATDVQYCTSLSGGVAVERRSTYVYSPNIAYAAIGSAIGSLFAGMAARAELRRKVSRIERTCMGDRGYRRHELDKETSRDLRKLDGAPLLDRMFELVAAAAPSGKVLVE